MIYLDLLSIWFSKNIEVSLSIVKDHENTLLKVEGAKLIEGREPFNHENYQPLRAEFFKYGDPKAYALFNSIMNSENIYA